MPASETSVRAVLLPVRVVVPLVFLFYYNYWYFACPQVRRPVFDFGFF